MRAARVRFASTGPQPSACSRTSATVPSSTQQPDPLLETERVSFYFLHVTQDDDGPIAATFGVEIPRGAPLTTSAYPGVVDRALSRYPALSQHRCDNGRKLGTREEFADTELAHLFEHILIEELVAAGALRGALSGETFWRFESTGWGRYTVRVGGVPAGVDLVPIARGAARATVHVLGV